MEGLRFSFDDTALEPVCAHRGAGKVLFKRVTNRRGASGINFIDFTVLPPGTSIGRHRHGCGDEEIYVVLEGQGLMTLDDEAFAVGPGDVIVNAPGGAHSLANPGPAPMKLAVIDVASDGGPLTAPENLKEPS